MFMRVQNPVFSFDGAKLLLFADMGKKICLKKAKYN